MISLFVPGQVMNETEDTIYCLLHALTHIEKKRNLRVCRLLYRFTEVSQYIVCWWGNLSVKNREKLNRIYTISCKIATCCTPGAIVQVKNTANGNQNLICPHPLLTQPLQPSPLWKEVQNANNKNPASP